MSSSAYGPIRFALATTLLVTTVLASIIAQASAAPFESRSVDLNDRFEAVNAAIIESQGWPDFDPSSLPDEGKSVTGPAPESFTTDANQDPD